MKVFKFKKVDAKTGISVDIEKPREGPANPNLPGLNVFFDFNNFTYANVDDSAEANPENYIFEITQEELTEDIKAKVDQFLSMYKADAYQEEIELRNVVFGKYHDTATSSGIYKYNEAVKFMTDGTPSADIATEASVRGVTETEIAEKIIINHESFRNKEAQIAGLRGKILDRLDAYVFDPDDALGSWIDLAERLEVIGRRDPVGPNIQPEDLDVKVGYYTPSLNLRWEYLNK
jgi:hypothetical protein